MQKTESTLSHVYLQKILHYSIITGQFYWLESTNRRIKVRSVAGTFDSNGYIRIRINGKPYQAHRLAWFWVMGKWPQNEIDHKNGVRDANYWMNIRDVTRSQNNCNIHIKTNNASGHKGVSWNKARQKWRAYITLGKKQKHLGLFCEIEMAYSERVKAEKKLFGAFARA